MQKSLPLDLQTTPHYQNHPLPNEPESFSSAAELNKKRPDKKQKSHPLPEEWQDYFYLDGSVKF